MQENTNTRNIILAILALMLVVSGVYYFITNNQKDDAENILAGEEEIINQEFGEFADFIKTNLEDFEKEELQTVLDLRQDRLIMIKDILDGAYEDGDMEAAWITVAEMRNKCQERMLTYIAGEKIEDFVNYCSKLAEEFDADYVLK